MCLFETPFIHFHRRTFNDYVTLKKTGKEMQNYERNF